MIIYLVRSMGIDSAWTKKADAETRAEELNGKQDHASWVVDELGLDRGETT